MRRLYKIIIILFICVLFTILVYFFSLKNSIDYLALGDGVASGETPYNIKGISFNDYFIENNHIKSYNENYSYKNNTIEKLINDINNNVKSDNKYLKQLIYEADVITIAIGMDETIKYSLTNDLNDEYIKKYCNNYERLIKILTNLNKKEIIIISLYNHSSIKTKDIIILNSMISNIADKYKCKFINISSFFKEDIYILDNKSYYFSHKVHYKIYQMIENTIISN